MTFLEFILCLALISVSAFLSGAEIALFSLSKFQIRSLRDRARSSYRYIKKLLADPGGVLGTILITNEVANISLSAIIGRAIARNPYLDSVSQFLPAIIPHWMVETFVGVMVTTPVILLFCEVTPKSLAAKGNYLIAPMTAKPLHLFYQLFAPLRGLLKLVVSTINQPMHGPDAKPDVLVKQNEFLLILEEGQKEGTIQESEVSLIKNMFELDRTTVDEIATPISKVHSLLSNTTIEQALASLRGVLHPRIPVLSVDRKQVLGFLYAKDLIEVRFKEENLKNPITTLIRKPMFVPSNTKLSTLFRKMTQQKNHIALVLGANGEPKSIISMTDIFDELFESVLPEEDEGE